jgi:3-hydroxybutyrate dehydrogenase
VQSLAGKIAIVTGAAGGMGRVIRGALEREGATVVPVDLAGDDCLLADVGTEAGNRQMVEHALARHGRLDLLVLTAGVQFMAPLADFPEEEWDRLLNVMAKGPYLAMRAAWPALTAHPGGRIVVVASTSSLFGGSHKLAYVAAKHAVLGVVRVAAIEGAPFGLTINAVGPGWVHTGMVDGQLDDHVRFFGGSREEALARMAADQPDGRFIDPAEVAAAVVFLASPAASGINGVLLPVDRGASAGG